MRRARYRTANRAAARATIRISDQSRRGCFTTCSFSLPSHALHTGSSNIAIRPPTNGARLLLRIASWCCRWEAGCSAKMTLKRVYVWAVVAASCVLLHAMKIAAIKPAQSRSVVRKGAWMQTASQGQCTYICICVHIHMYAYPSIQTQA